MMKLYLIVLLSTILLFIPNLIAPNVVEAQNMARGRPAAQISTYRRMRANYLTDGRYYARGGTYLAHTWRHRYAWIRV